MAGELVPLVMLPRYSMFAGASTEFTTIAMDVTEYENAILNCWRGPLSGGGAFQMTFEESTDQVTWSTCAGTTANWDPGASTEAQVTAQLKKRWFRVKVNLTGTDPVVSCWVVGALEERLA
jgi:hypothetical protein